MCFFPRKLFRKDSFGRDQVLECGCGSCPECLRQRSNVWALRAVYEAKAHVHNCMVTLTYDSFMRDSKGEIVRDSRGRPLENPVDPDLKVNKRDIQLFIKRLRKCIDSKGSRLVDVDPNMKFFAAAEYGSRTHRAHYHLVLFGVHFLDASFYKRSKRGNVIYMSKTLTNLWRHGICTIDSMNVQSAIARYCTKYCAKSRSDETFMLFSHKVGYDYLMRDFNGLSYWIDGREYPVPRFIWQEVISARHPDVDMSFRYVNRTEDNFEEFQRANQLREVYRQVRDNDLLYMCYVDYWQRKSERYQVHRLPVRERILQLDDSKYHAYKQKALFVLDFRYKYFVPLLAPDSNCGKHDLYQYCGYSRFSSFVPDFVHLENDILSRYGESFAFPSRLNTANDTKFGKFEEKVLTGDFEYVSIDLSEQRELSYNAVLEKYLEVF